MNIQPYKTLVSPTVTFLGPSFQVGDVVEWVVDLSEKFPSGILCSKLRALLFPLIPEESMFDDVASVDHYSTIVIHPEEEEIPHAYVAYSQPSPLEVEVGREYKLTLPILPEHIRGQSSKYQLFMECIPIAKEESEVREQEDELEQGEIIAESEVFELHEIPNFPQPSTSASIHDITPLDSLSPEDGECPITKTSPTEPILVNAKSKLLGKQRVYEKEALLAFLEGPFSIHPNHGPMICPFRSPIQDVCIDEQLYHAMRVYAACEFSTLQAKRAELRASIGTKGNLRTKLISDASVTPWLTCKLSFGEFMRNAGFHARINEVHSQLIQFKERRDRRRGLNFMLAMRFEVANSIFAFMSLITFGTLYYTTLVLAGGHSSLDQARLSAHFASFLVGVLIAVLAIKAHDRVNGVMDNYVDQLEELWDEAYVGFVDEIRALPNFRPAISETESRVRFNLHY